MREWDWVGWVRVISGIGFVSEVDDDEEGLSYFNVLNNITMRNTQCGD